MTRREFVVSSAAAAGTKMSSRERVDRVLRGDDVDRPPFSFWHHFGLQKSPGEKHAQATLEFHRKFHTDIVKVMSDYPYPKPVKVEDNPFPEQIRALEMIRDSLGEDVYFVETIFNPYNQAEKVYSKSEVARMKREQPQALLDAVETIARSEANHARRALAAGAAGIFLAVDNAQESSGSREDYIRFCEPFDKMVLEAVRTAKLNLLHLHGEKVYLDRFDSGWPVAALNYSSRTTGVPVAAMRGHYSGVLMCGIDEVDYRKLSEADIKRQWQQAQQAAGAKFILSPGCSVPDDSTDEELSRLPRVVGV